MLEAITDFWKPSKKPAAANMVKPEEVVVGSTIVFGFVPQMSISGQRVKISSVNTYQFGNEALTSLQMVSDNAQAASLASLIFAESEDEYYLAISRRVTSEEQAKLFDAGALAAVMNSADVTRLPCNALPEFKGWVVGSYKREIKGMKGRIYRGDFRKAKLPELSQSQEFDYMLLVSDSNEQAIEIEKYADGRMEIYATVYRRMSDIADVIYSPVAQPVLVSDSAAPAAVPAQPVLQSKEAAPVVAAEEQKTQPIKLPELDASQLVVPPAAAPQLSSPEPVVVKAAASSPVIETKQAEPAAIVEPAAPAKPEPKLQVPEKPEAGPVPVILAAKPETPAEPVVAAVKQPEPAPAPAQPSVQEAPVAPVPVAATTQEVKQTPITNNHNGETKTMSNAFAENDLKPKLTAVVSNPSEAPRADVRAVPAREAALEADSIECDLRVANKIIEEAIRNEMRLADVVRRIVELPVSNPESVQIPMTLTDEDYSLLAIRYGISAGDKNAIKRRIIEDLNDFSGAKKAG